MNTAPEPIDPDIEKAPRERQINVRVNDFEFDAIWAAYLAARASEPRLSLAEWVRRKAAGK